MSFCNSPPFKNSMLSLYFICLIHHLFSYLYILISHFLGASASGSINIHCLRLYHFTHWWFICFYVFLCPVTVLYSLIFSPYSPPTPLGSTSPQCAICSDPAYMFSLKPENCSFARVHDGQAVAKGWFGPGRIRGLSNVSAWPCRRDCM
jgi:hypothetical protein